MWKCHQTAEHILLECGILREERELLIAAVAAVEMLIKKHYKAFAEFTKTIDKSKNLKHCKERRINESTNIHTQL